MLGDWRIGRRLFKRLALRKPHKMIELTGFFCARLSEIFNLETAIDDRPKWGVTGPKARCFLITVSSGQPARV